jgi:hypothetical protein
VKRLLICFIFILLTIAGYRNNACGTSPPDSETLLNCQISGTITDVSSTNAVDHAKISLLDPFTGEVLCTDIYTDEYGQYDVGIDLEFTGVSYGTHIAHSFYRIVEIHPNPVTFGHETVICYQVPNNIPEIPVVQLYNILGRKVDRNAYLPGGIYICRLKFNNGHISQPGRLLLTSGGIPNLSLKQVFDNPEQALKKTKSGAGLTGETGSVEVLFVIEKSGYACMERSRILVGDTNNITDFSLVPAGNQSVAVLDTTGGIVTVTNSRNDSITLVIPRYALWEPTTITLTTFDIQPNNPIQKNIFPGVSISPCGFRPHRPAILKVHFAETGLDTSVSTLFYIKQSDFVLPLGNLSVTDSSIEGEIYHFSDYSGGNPSENEVLDQAGKAAEVCASNVYDWQGTYEPVKALERWYHMLEFYENNNEAEAAFQEMQEILKKDAENFINQPVPENPCGRYKNTLMKYIQLILPQLTEPYLLTPLGDLWTLYIDRLYQLLDHCTIAGDITCDYELEQKGGGFEEKWIVEEEIPIFPSGPGQIKGYGISNISVKGQADECFITGYGTNTITIEGELRVDTAGDFWLDVNWTEAWWTTSSITTYCPDMPSYTYSQPPHTDDNFLSFRVWNRAYVQRPNGFTWILHLYDLYPDSE